MTAKSVELWNYRPCSCYYLLFNMVIPIVHLIFFNAKFASSVAMRLVAINYYLRNKFHRLLIIVKL